MIKIICWSINFINFRKERCVISKQFAFTFNISLDKPLIHIKSNKGPKMDLCGAPAGISTRDEHLPFKTTFCFRSLGKSSKILIISPQILLCCSLKISPSCHTLSKALEMSRNISKTSSCISKTLKILWLIERSWLMQESPGLNRD